jgi:hypothetical protein
VRIALTPTKVALASRKTYREVDAATPDWKGSMRALEGLLQKTGVKGTAGVVLSHQFAHVHLLPAPPVVLKPSEMHNWVRDQLASLLGETGRDWQVAWQTMPPGKPFLAVYLAESYMTELVEQLRKSGIRPSSIQPWLAVSWNHVRRRFDKGQSWFALAEPGKMTLAGLVSEEIKSLRSTAYLGEPVKALADLIRRESMMSGEDPSAGILIDSILLRETWQGLPGHTPVRVVTTGVESLSSMLGV